MIPGANEEISGGPGEMIIAATVSSSKESTIYPNDNEAIYDKPHICFDIFNHIGFIEGVRPIASPRRSCTANDSKFISVDLYMESTESEDAVNEVNGPETE